MTDSASTYQKVAKPYNRQSVNHSKGEYVRGNVHINSVETFWAHVKRSIRGTHKAVSPKHLQTCVDGFVWLFSDVLAERTRSAGGY
jgi:transposase